MMQEHEPVEVSNSYDAALHCTICAASIDPQTVNYGKGPLPYDLDNQDDPPKNKTTSRPPKDHRNDTRKPPEDLIWTFQDSTQQQLHHHQMPSPPRTLWWASSVNRAPGHHSTTGPSMDWWDSAFLYKLFLAPSSQCLQPCLVGFERFRGSTAAWPNSWCAGGIRRCDKNPSPVY